MNDQQTLPDVSIIMMEFAEQTGLVGERAPRRYLWTDAFAVCNFLQLWRQTADDDYLQLAERLIAQVHHTLGQHRPDDPRSGWLSGLTDEEGEKHPTRGGLRIGKRLPERGRNERYDDRLEWDRDGQYFHYLTRWMHALNRASQATGEQRYNRWARELAQRVHRAFVYTLPSGEKRMYWKMSIDLSYPLVPSMGHHDPLDGYLTYNELQATADEIGNQARGPDLADEIADMAQIAEGKSWTTDDPLGLGGLLADGYRAAQLASLRDLAPYLRPHLLLQDALPGLQAYLRRDPLPQPAAYRLAFREEGLAIGLHAIERLDHFLSLEELLPDSSEALAAITEQLLRASPLAKQIESFWLEPQNQEVSTWVDHADINMVMLATALAPASYLTVRPLG